MDPIFDAIGANDVLRVKVLLVSTRGKIDALDEEKRTPLIRAVMEGRSELVRLFIMFGSHLIDRRDKQGCSALDYAIRSDNREIAELLLNAGARLNHADEQTEGEPFSQEPFVWCLVGNIVEKRYNGATRKMEAGTKKFAPNAKVYCFPVLWGDGYEEITVIGKLRRRKNLGVVITSSKFITNWRLQKVFQPFVVRVMRERGGWDASEESRTEIEGMLTWLPSRTALVEVSPEQD